MKTLEEIKKAIKGTQFEKDLQKSIKVNNGQMSVALWNLICSIRDCKLYAKGIIIHRNWRITDVKRYFGVKGNADKVAEQLVLMKELLFQDKRSN